MTASRSSTSTHTKRRAKRSAPKWTKSCAATRCTSSRCSRTTVAETAAVARHPRRRRRRRFITERARHPPIIAITVRRLRCLRHPLLGTIWGGPRLLYRRHLPPCLDPGQEIDSDVRHLHLPIVSLISLFWDYVLVFSFNVFFSSFIG